MAVAVTAEQAHVEVVAVRHGPRLLTVPAHQPKAEVALDHLPHVLQGHLWRPLRAALNVLGVLTEDVAC